jgi:lysozyme
LNKLKRMLKRHEGKRHFAYRCSEGKLTIGVGRCIDENGGIGLSEEEIDYLLDADIVRCLRELSVFEWFSDLDEVRQDAMVSICLNLGLTRLRSFKKALQAMKYNLYEEAATEFLDSKWHSQVGFRAKELAEMIRTGDYPEK